MSWNWIKIKTIEDAPPFNVPVALYEEKNGNKYALIGMLTSIDANGYHWESNTDNSLLGMFNLFNQLQVENKDKFNPSHWCEIEIPED